MPKTNPPVSTEKDIRPISITRIAAKLFESILMKWVDEAIEGNIDAKQFYGIDIIPLSDHITLYYLLYPLPSVKQLIYKT